MITCFGKFFLFATLCGCVQATLQRRVPKQIHSKAAVPEVPEADSNPAETHFGGGEHHGHGGHGKYFMYQHVPHKDHYEFGFRRGNEHHFKERYEKAQPHHGHFKTKARWGDKHGGYGEHYWDYNHGGHHGDDGGSDDDEGGDESDPVPDYQLRGEPEDRVKRQQHHDLAAAPSIAAAPRHTVPSSDAAPRHAATTDTASSLVYDEESDTVVDEATGRRYLLTPIN